MMTKRYAETTRVSSEESRAEIERTLRRYGATGFSYGWDDEHGAAMIMFRTDTRLVRFILPLPSKADFTTKQVDWGTSHNGKYISGKRTAKMSPEQQERAWEQACRQRWRALALVIKAKLEAVEAGISSIESEFLANIVLPDNTTLGQWAAPQIEQAYKTGQMPKLLNA